MVRRLVASWRSTYYDTMDPYFFLYLAFVAITETLCFRHLNSRIVTTIVLVNLFFALFFAFTFLSPELLQ